MSDTEVIERDISSTFADNMSLPIHKWFRYTAGFSASWVNEIIENELGNRTHLNILEPFAGSGTVLLESEFSNVNCIGIEPHPYIYRIAKAKLSWRENVDELRDYSHEIYNLAKACKKPKYNFPSLIYKCYSEEALESLSRLRFAWENHSSSEVMKLFGWFIITSILRVTSKVGTAQWQYVLPNKGKAKIFEPFLAFERKADEMIEDMISSQNIYEFSTPSEIFQEDARSIKSVPDGWANLVITSPPYANNYDYADATRLEMSFWGDVDSYKDLQKNVREKLVRACTQHVAGMKEKCEEYLNSQDLQAINIPLRKIYNELGEVRKSKGGKKNYHFMIVSYFYDLSKVFQSLRLKCAEGAKLCFVIGDSAPYGVYVPVDTFLGELALSAGFNNYEFEKTRDRNVKWKNRKHTVLLKEGRLWIK